MRMVLRMPVAGQPATMVRSSSRSGHRFANDFCRFACWLMLGAFNVCISPGVPQADPDVNYWALLANITVQQSLIGCCGLFFILLAVHNNTAIIGLEPYCLSFYPSRAFTDTWLFCPQYLHTPRSTITNNIEPHILNQHYPGIPPCKQ